MRRPLHVHHPVGQSGLFERLQHAEQRYTVGPVGEGPLHIGLGQRAVTALQQVQHILPDARYPQAMRTKMFFDGHATKLIHAIELHK